MMSLNLLLTSLLLSIFSSVTHAILLTTTPQLNDAQKAVFDAFEHYLDDYDQIKNRHAPNANILFCAYPAPCQEFVGYDAAFGPFKDAFATFDSEYLPLTVTNDVLTFRWTNFATTTKGCSAVFSGVTFMTFDKENGLVKDHRVYSDSFAGVLECMQEYQVDDEESKKDL